MDIIWTIVLVAGAAICTGTAVYMISKRYQNDKKLDTMEILEILTKQEELFAPLILNLKNISISSDYDKKEIAKEAVIKLINTSDIGLNSIQKEFITKNIGYFVDFILKKVNKDKTIKEEKKSELDLNVEKESKSDK